MKAKREHRGRRPKSFERYICHEFERGRTIEEIAHRTRSTTAELVRAILVRNGLLTEGTDNVHT